MLRISLVHEFFTKRIVLGCAALLLSSVSALAIDAPSTVATLRLANTITGGFMPSNDPLFGQMLVKVQAGDIQGAAALAANSRYFANYLARRLAFQMQNPSLDAGSVTDSDATAFLIAHFVGAGTAKPSISSIWSENATYLVNVTANGVTSQVHAASLTAAQLAAVDWSSSLVQVAGQTAKAQNGSTSVAIPDKHVGGYTTLSDRVGDNSFAMYGATAGTNLRMIEGIWEISTGLQLADVESQNGSPADAPRFVPENDPNFFHGQGQVACISCHGGGMSSLTHGYATVADIFDFDAKNGFTFIATPTTATMKSYGSDPAKRAQTATCNLSKTPTAVCNPDSAGASPTQDWDVQKTWASSGVLAAMGWKGPMQGSGLNALGNAIGQSGIVYEFLTKRVVNEICPMGIFTPTQVSAIASAANPYANPAGTDDIRTIVAMVAANPSCQ